MNERIAMGRYLAASLLLVCGACSGQKSDANDNRLLVLSFPDSSNPPTKNLIHGLGGVQSIKEGDTGAKLLSEALLRCGVNRFFWRELAYHGETVVIEDNEQNRAAVHCAAKAMPWDFYMKTEQVTQTP